MEPAKDGDRSTVLTGKKKQDVLVLHLRQKYEKSVISKTRQRVVLIPPILWQSYFLCINAVSQVKFIVHAELQSLICLLLLSSY